MEDSPNHLPLFRIQLLSSAAPTRSFLRLYSTLLRLCRPPYGESLTHRPLNAPLISSLLSLRLCRQRLTATQAGRAARAKPSKLRVAATHTPLFFPAIRPPVAACWSTTR